MRRELLRDSVSQTMAMPAEYMFHDVPEKEIDRQADPVAITIAAMDQHGIGVGLVSVSAAPEVAARALRDHPDRFVASATAEGRKSDVSGKSVSVRFDLGCRRYINKKTYLTDK